MLATARGDKSHRVQMSRTRRHYRRTPSPSQHWVLGPRWHGGSAGQRVDDTLPLRTLSTLCIQHTRAAMGEATSCPQHSSASASFTSQWPYSATQQAGGKSRQSNATGGRNAPLHKINWCSGTNRVKSRRCSCVANPPSAVVNSFAFGLGTTAPEGGDVVDHGF